MSGTQTGTFLSYDKNTRTGFIEPIAGSPLEFHARDIKDENRTAVKIGAQVCFVPERGPTGMVAKEIRHI